MTTSAERDMVTVTPARFEARVRSSLRALVTGRATEDQLTAEICADAADLSAWWVEQSHEGVRRDVRGREVPVQGGAA